MPKPSFKLIYLLLFFTINAKAQGNWQYQSKYTENYSLASLDVNKGYFERADHIFLWVKNAEDIRQFVGKGYNNKVMAVRLEISRQDELNQSLALLDKFPNLKYLNLYPNRTDHISKNLQLPADIEKLQQLVGFEFSTAAIDMDDALNKLATLKNLQVISFTGYHARLPASISALSHIDSIKLSTTNIGNNNFSGVHWQKVHVVSDEATWRDTTGVLAKAEEKALLNLATIPTLKQVYFDDLLMKNPAVIKKFTQVDDMRMILGGKGDPIPFLTGLSTLKNLHTLYIELLYDEPISISWVKNLTALKNLYIGGHDIPFKDFESLGELTNLETLSLHQCNINPMPDIFGKLGHLKTFSLSLNGITKVPANLFNLPELENLALVHDGITTLPNMLTYGCTKLKHIDLSGNKLTALPNAIGNLTQLEIINCQENKIENIPGGWADFKNLREVNFAGNRLKEFPEGLQNNHSVESINLLFNQIKNFPDIEGEGFKLTNLGIMGNRQMQELPAHIGSYTELEELQADQLSLESLPESLGNCKKLKKLYLTNSIAATMSLPASLKDIKSLETLNLDQDPLLDHQSIFDVILSQPRKNFVVNLNSDEIKQLPASKKWATTPFRLLSLRENQLSSLPVEFAEIPIFDQIDLSLNEITKNLTRTTYFTSRADLKVMFDILNIPLPNVNISKRDYAKSLTFFSVNLGNTGQWQKAVEFADKAIVLDSAVYAKNTAFDVIGICRFNVKDYKGAIKDFDRLINQVKKQGTQPGNPKDIRHFKALAHLALNQPYEAARAYATMSSVADFIEAAKICRQLADKKIYHQLLDTALLSFKIRMDWNEHRDYNHLPDFFMITPNPNTIKIGYATLLLIANEPAETMRVLNKVSPIKDWYPQEPAVKDFLVAATNYLLYPDSLDSIKNSLMDDVSKNGKITGYQLVPFNDWLPYTSLSQKQQNDLLTLQNIAQ